MENKKVVVLFSLVLIVFFVFTTILVKKFNAQRAEDIKGYANALTAIVRQENEKIIILSNQLAIEEKENTDLKNTLTDARNSLESLTGKLIK